MIGLLCFMAGVVCTVGIGTATVLMLSRFKMLRNVEHDTLMSERVSTLETTVASLVMSHGQHRPGVTEFSSQAEAPADAELHDVSTDGLSR